MHWTWDIVCSATLLRGFPALSQFLGAVAVGRGSWEERGNYIVFIVILATISASVDLVKDVNTPLAIPAIVMSSPSRFLALLLCQDS